jgi:hypothetical protein
MVSGKPVRDRPESDNTGCHQQTYGGLEIRNPAWAGAAGKLTRPPRRRQAVAGNIAVLNYRPGTLDSGESRLCRHARACRDIPAMTLNICLELSNT